MKLLALASITALFYSLKEKKTAPQPFINELESNPKLATKIARQKRVMKLMNLAIKDKNSLKQVQAMYILQQLNNQ